MSQDTPDNPDWFEWILLFLTVGSWLEERLAPTFYWFGIHFMRWSFAIIFLWFGALKLFIPPSVTFLFTQELMDILPAGFPFLIGYWEVVIGLCFLHVDWIKYGLWQMKVHMLGTFLPLFVIPSDAFAVFPYIPALPGLYIIKNLVFIAGAFILWAEVLADKPFGQPPPSLRP